MTRVLVTGATGFVGTHLVAALRDRGKTVVALARDLDKARQLLPAAEVCVRQGDLSRPESLKGACEGVDTIFHLAGYAHDVDARDAVAEALYRSVTVDGTRALVAEALRAGVAGFIFASSVKAMGEGGPTRLDESSPEQPTSAYGRAKLAAERCVLETGGGGKMRCAVLRFPLVYGPGNKGNLPRMIQAVDRGLFPPMPESGNRRSMLHIDNAVQALLLAADRKEAGGETYCVTDASEYSTRQIYELIMAALGKSPPSMTVPIGLLRFGAKIGDAIGQLRNRRFVFDSEALEKLTGSACYSSEKIASQLGYRAEKGLSDALPVMVAEYRAESAGA